MENIKIRQLENRIMALEEWKKQKDGQQISFPLDNQSIDILNKYFMRITNKIIYQSGVGGNTFINYFGKQEGLDFEVSPISLIQFSVNVDTNYLTTVQSYGNIKFFNGFVVDLVSTGTLPSPLTFGVPYHVINSDGYTFQLSETSGGAAIDITDIGNGDHYIR